MLENDQAKLVIDPGEMVSLPKDLAGVVAIVISHEHYDHYHPDHLQQLLAANPQAAVLTTPAVATKLAEIGLEAKPVEAQETFNLGGFEISLKDEAHAPIWHDSPCRVLTVKIDDFLYYPSDCLVVCPTKVKVLATPTSGPWLKLAEVLDFSQASESDYLLPVHNYMLTDKANSSTNSRLETLVAKPADRELMALSVGQSHDF